MKNYTREQIETIVNQASENILRKTTNDLAKEIQMGIQDKSDVDALIETLSTLYASTQENTKQLIIETLNKLFND